MRFFSPLNLLWLLWLVPIIVFFYLLKLKRKQTVVSSVLLWSQLVKDVQANAPFQKLRRNLLLLLQLLIAILTVFALARPAYIANALGGNQVVVILDGSASMQSRDARGTRFDEAKAIALRMVSSMRGGDRMMLLLATDRAHRLTGFTTDKNELRRAIGQASARDTTTDIRDALLLAVSVAGSSVQNAGTRIYVISDGAFPEMEALDTREAEVQFVKVGSRSNNVGLVAMDVRRTFRDEGSYQMYVAVRSYSSEPRRCNLAFYRDEALIDVRPLELPAADRARGYSERAEVFTNLREVSGILTARLEDLRDDLAVDNEAYAQLSPRRNLNVLLVTEGNLYLEKALNVDPHVRLSVVPAGGYTGQSGFDVVVFENKGPAKVGPGSHLYINCGGPTAPVEIEGKITDAEVVDWERAHPAMRFVKLSQLHLLEALTATARPWAVTLAEHAQGPVIAVGEKGGVKSAYVGFPLLKSEFPLRVAFPIFFNNLVQWLAARPGRTEGLQIASGQPAPIELPAGVSEVTVTDPAGHRTKVRSEGRIAYFGETDRRGIYTVEGKGVRQEFAVNLLSRDESATQPQDKIQLGRQPLLAGSGTVKTARETWRWLVLVALLVLAVEWWVYHRRI